MYVSYVAYVTYVAYVAYVAYVSSYVSSYASSYASYVPKLTLTFCAYFSDITFKKSSKRITMPSRTSSETGAVTYAAPAKIAAIAATTTTATATATIVHISIIDTIPATATNDDSALTYVSMKNVNIVRYNFSDNSPYNLFYCPSKYKSTTTFRMDPGQSVMILLDQHNDITHLINRYGAKINTTTDPTTLIRYTTPERLVVRASNLSRSIIYDLEMCLRSLYL